MSITADRRSSASGARLLEFFRDGKTQYADAGFPKEDFKIGAQVAYFLCVNIDRVREFAESEGLRPSHGFREDIKVGKGYVREVVWSMYEDFAIGDKIVRLPCLGLDWVAAKGRVGALNFGVEKAKAIISGGELSLPW